MSDEWVPSGTRRLDVEWSPRGVRVISDSDRRPVDSRAKDISAAIDKAGILDQSEAETSRLSRLPPEQEQIRELGQGWRDVTGGFGPVLNSAQRASAGISRTGKAILGPLAKPFEMVNEYATSKGYPLTPTERQLQEGAPTTLPGKVVGFGTDLAMSLAPIGAANRVAQTVGALRGVPVSTAGLAGADIAANTGWSALSAPEDKLEAAAWGGGGAAGGRVLSKALQGLVTPGPRAAELLKQNVTPTVGQVMGETGGVFGEAVKRAEDFLASIPALGAGTRVARDRALDQWRTATRTAAGGLPTDTSIADVGRTLARTETDAAIRQAQGGPLAQPVPRENYAPLRHVAETADLPDPSKYRPRHLLNSIRALDDSPTKRGYIEGGDLPQQKLAKAGGVVLDGDQVAPGVAGGAVEAAMAFLTGGSSLASLPVGMAAAWEPLQRALIKLPPGARETAIQRMARENPEVFSNLGRALLQETQR